MKKRFFKFLPVFLSFILCFEAACAGNPGNRQTQQVFTEYTDQIFRSEVSASTLNMHYTLAHPENFGISQYAVTYGTISQKSEEQNSLILENWKKKLSGFKKKDLTVSQQMTYDIMIDYIEKELKVSGMDIYDEILRPSTGFQSQLPVLLAEYTFYDERDIQDYLKLISCTPDFSDYRYREEEIRKGTVYGRFCSR